MLQTVQRTGAGPEISLECRSKGCGWAGRRIEKAQASLGKLAATTFATLSGGKQAETKNHNASLLGEFTTKAGGLHVLSLNPSSFLAALSSGIAVVADLCHHIL